MGVNDTGYICNHYMYEIPRARRRASHLTVAKEDQSETDEGFYKLTEQVCDVHILHR